MDASGLLVDVGGRSVFCFVVSCIFDGFVDVWSIDVVCILDLLSIGVR